MTDDNHKKLSDWRVLVLAIAWLVFFTLPIAFLFSKPGSILDGDWLAGVFAALDALFGEMIARWIFCGLWILFNALLFWRFVLSKHRLEDLPKPFDVDD